MATSVWPTVPLRTASGADVDAIAPLIISASRSTDIPAFYAPWFMNRLAAGYARWVNPFNLRSTYVSFEKARLVVFWSKNPAPLIPHLDELDRRGIGCYFQFTLNDYETEGLEPHVPPLGARVQAFRKLSQRVGADRVIWRTDPLVLSSTVTVDVLLSRISRLAEQLAGCTRALVFSFVDIDRYAKVGRNLAGCGCREFSDAEMLEFAQKLAAMSRLWGLRLATCAEPVDLSGLGVEHNRCIDDELIARLYPQDEALMRFLGRGVGGGLGSGDAAAVRRRLKDKGQRAACGCVLSKDIGAYNTCAHLCRYCYANSSDAEVAASVRSHREDGESIAGEA